MDGRAWNTSDIDRLLVVLLLPGLHSACYASPPGGLPLTLVWSPGWVPPSPSSSYLDPPSWCYYHTSHLCLCMRLTLQPPCWV